jgi:hypothetical protein
MKFEGSQTEFDQLVKNTPTGFGLSISFYCKLNEKIYLEYDLVESE